MKSAQSRKPNFCWKARSFATPLLEARANLPTDLRLLGRAEAPATLPSLHVMKRPSAGAPSSPDNL
jgi:hypothetical protein